MHDPCNFADRSESSADEDAIEGCVPECDSVVVNFWEKASPSTLEHIRATKRLHPPDVFVNVFGSLGLSRVQ